MFSTDNGEDSQGYAATIRDTDIGALTNTTAAPNENGVGVFTIELALMLVENRVKL